MLKSTIKAAQIWANIGYRAAAGYCRNNGIPIGAARLALQLRRVYGAWPKV